jgi:L-threonylcarbamoyladenylate synthase
MNIVPSRNGDELKIAVAKATEVLKSGGVIIYPTDTLYGLGADAFSNEAVDAIYAIKGRTEEKPIHCVVMDLGMAERYAELNGVAHALAARFLPGPLTLILKKKKTVKKGIGRNMETIGIRIPDNEFCRELARSFDAPFTTTSANKAGLLQGHAVGNILTQLNDSLPHIDLVIDGGDVISDKPSTVVDVSHGKVTILREGGIPASEILDALERK